MVGLTFGLGVTGLVLWGLLSVDSIDVKCGAILTTSSVLGRSNIFPHVVQPWIFGSTFLTGSVRGFGRLNAAATGKRFLLRD